MISVERLHKYTYADAKGLGLLRPLLITGASDSPIPEKHLRHIIESKDHELFVARLKVSGEIIGTATISKVSGALSKDKAWLEDFVANTTVTHGIGKRIWDEIGDWCTQQNLELAFTSKPHRIAAHKFYLKNGAEIRNTTSFKKTFKKQ